MPKKLAEYQRKRRFHATPEPRGKQVRGKGELTFLVHLHDATRLHYDLRLELDGVLKSWAVPKGPSLNPTEQRLAVHVEDHPMEYGEFEGVIPEGNYGAGPVVVWDRGTYHERRSKTRAESEAALRKALAKGHITFVLEGEKLKGEFALIRLKDGKNWLLIKKGDAHSSYRPVKWDDSSVVSGKTLTGVRETVPATWTRAGKSGLPRTRLSAPVLRREPPAGNSWIVQEFGSGERVLVEIENSQARILSRIRVPLHKKHAALAKALPKLANSAVFDGELEGETLRLLDVLYLNGKDLREDLLEKRLKALAKLKLPKGVELCPQISLNALAGSWVARDKKSVYKGGIQRDWIRGRQGRASSVRITHPEKKLWPKEGYTKKDLVDYYRAVSPQMLPHLRDRPLSLVRFPNGIGSAGFFQKDLIGQLPPGMQTFPHYSESSGRTIHYAVCQDEASLAYIANLACIEINPWLSHVPGIDNADFAVIDLDPDGNPFKDVVKVALAVKKILDSIGAESFCKTSGATGLHIVVPWSGKVSYDASREFALAISRRILEQFPKITSLERSPAKRRGKIYLDCFQNARGQTIVAPYSVRPRESAPVSTPLEWRELTPRLNPSRYTIRTVPARLQASGDPWKDLPSAGNELPKLLKRLK
ncbi:non-homologous end-joining DNA ligase [bacterium]|nr:non-homologous end-joining DNA ligase [bacterium]